jgi:two-component system, cell cycle response regulator DivK
MISGEGSREGEQEFLPVADAVRVDLEEALALAFSATLAFDRDADGQVAPGDGAITEQLTAAVAAFASDLKRLGVPPQKVLVALKSLIRRQPGAETMRHFEAIQGIATTAAIKAYYGEDPGEGVRRTPPGLQLEGIAAEHSARHPSRPVLVVDDDADTRYIFSTYLKSRGYDVFEAPDGRDVLKIARRLQPSVVLLDIGLPYVSGHDVLRQLRSDPDTREIPVIAVTGDHSIAESPPRIVGDFADILLKPVRPAVLLQRIEARIRSRSK